MSPVSKVIRCADVITRPLNLYGKFDHLHTSETVDPIAKKITSSRPSNSYILFINNKCKILCIATSASYIAFANNNSAKKQK